MKTILVGQAPSRNSDPSSPLSKGASVEEYLDAFERRNVLNAWPGRSMKGDAFPMELARASVAAMEADLAWRNWGSLGERAVAPHPSGVNRWYNDPANVVAARDFFRAEFERSRRGRLSFDEAEVS